MKLSAEELSRFAELAAQAEAARAPEAPTPLTALVAARRAGLARRG